MAMYSLPELWGKERRNREKEREREIEIERERQRESRKRKKEKVKIEEGVKNGKFVWLIEKKKRQKITENRM